MRCRRLLLLAIVVALPLAFMWQTLLLGRPLVRDDAQLFVYPQYRALGETLRAGDLYLWDARQYCGLPALATGQSGGLYPIHLVAFRLLPWMTALHFCYWLHLALAMAGFVWVARNLGMGRTAALVGAGVYAFSGYQAGHLIHYNFVTAAAHLPLALGVLQTGLRRGSWRWWGLLGLEVALAFLSSHPQIFLMIMFTLAVWVLVGERSFVANDAPQDDNEGRQDAKGGNEKGGDGRQPVILSEAKNPRVLPVLVGILAAALLAGLLIAPQVLPTLELARETKRELGTQIDQLSWMQSYAFELRDVARVLLPDVFGTVRANVIGGEAFFHETSAYLGGAPLLLALVGLIVGWRRRGWLFALVLLLVGASLVWAGNPVYAVLAKLPLVGGFRAMGRWALLPMFAVGLLVSMAAQWLPQATERQKQMATKGALGLAGLVVFALFSLWMTFGAEGGSLVLPGHPALALPLKNTAAAMYNSLTGWQPVVLVAALLVACAWVRIAGMHSVLLRAALVLALLGPLWHFWQVTNPVVGREYYQQPPGSAQAIGSGRMVSVPQELVAAMPASEQPPGGQWMYAEGYRSQLRPAFGTLFDVRYSDGYKQGIVTPATLQMWNQYQSYQVQALTGTVNTSEETIERVGTPLERMKRFHALVGAQFIVTPGNVQDPALKRVWEGETSVWRYEPSHPRAWLVGQAIAAPSVEAQMQIIKQRDFQPYAQAVVEGEVGGLTRPGQAGTASVAAEDTYRVRVTLEASRPALLVLADAWYPGWEVTVDGLPAPLLRANYGLKAVAVRAGWHEVIFNYHPRPWRVGLVSLALGLVLLLVLVTCPYSAARSRRY